MLLRIKCLYFDPQDITEVPKAQAQQTPPSRESGADWKSSEFCMRYFSVRKYSRSRLVMGFSKPLLGYCHVYRILRAMFINYAKGNDS
jgi:hypothetical protein